MKILIVYNSQKYKYHEKTVETILAVAMKQFGKDTVVDKLDMSSDCPLHELFYRIRDNGAQLIITLDLAGFELRTENDSISLNGIHSRIVNILLKGSDSFAGELKCRQNLSMYTYIPARENHEAVSRRYPGIPNLSVFCEYDYTADSDDKLSQNRNNLELWFKNMTEEIRL